MNRLPTNLYTATQVRELDRIAIQEFKIPGITLMERAGKATFDLIQKKWPHAKKIAVVCGSGNNAGDGFIVAHLLAKAKKNVTVISLSDPKKLKGAALVAYRRWEKGAPPPTGGRVSRATVEGQERGGANYFRFDLLVDALFGSGLDRPVTGIFKKTIAAMNKSGRPLLAIDIPSGLNADTGSVMGSAVQATATICFIGLKQGCFTNDGPDCCGEIYFNNLGVPPQIYNTVSPSSVISVQSDLSVIFKRKKNSHKGLFGHVLVIGGAEGTMGAAFLASTAALRMGAGLVSLATDEKHVARIVLKQPEIMAFDWKNKKILEERLKAATVIAIGPGLGQSGLAKKLLTKVLKTTKPLIVDADALNLLAKHPIRRDNWILTPHPGEAARMLKCTTAKIQNDRFAAARKLQQRFGGFIVLKGCGSLVIGLIGPISLINRGNPAMASGGMGDVLTGMIAGLVAQGLSLTDAAKSGVLWHAQAGDAAAKKKKFILASDLLNIIGT